MVFLRPRYYSPSFGIFIGRDPISVPIQVRGHIGWFLAYIGLLFHPQSLNFYTYAHNNPIGPIDPSGLSSNYMGACTDECDKLKGPPQANCYKCCILNGPYGDDCEAKAQGVECAVKGIFTPPETPHGKPTPPPTGGCNQNLPFFAVIIFMVLLSFKSFLLAKK